MVARPGAWPRVGARALLDRNYTLSRRYALSRMARRREPPTVVFSMGKTGSTAIARAVHDAIGRPVFQVFRLEPTRLRDAEDRYRQRRRRSAQSGEGDTVKGKGFPGASHLWEADHLVRHPPSPEVPWTVITTVREPVAQAVSAYFHAARQAGASDAPTVGDLTDRFASENWVSEPLRWFEREFSGAVGIDALAQPFDWNIGHGIIATPSVRLLLLRQENFAFAPTVLASFLGLAAPVTVPPRNVGARGQFGDIYRRFLAEARLSKRLLDQAYDSRYARHFYAEPEIAQFRRRWSSE
jgi:hypothetical protein